MRTSLNTALKPLGLEVTAAELYRSKYPPSVTFKDRRQMGWAVTFYDVHKVLQTSRMLIPGTADPYSKAIFDRLIAFLLRS